MRSQGLHKQVCDAFEHFHQTKEYTEISLLLLIFMNKVSERRCLGFQILCSHTACRTWKTLYLPRMCLFSVANRPRLMETSNPESQTSWVIMQIEFSSTLAIYKIRVLTGKMWNLKSWMWLCGQSEDTLGTEPLKHYFAQKNILSLASSISLLTPI